MYTAKTIIFGGYDKAKGQNVPDEPKENLPQRENKAFSNQILLMEA